MWLETTSYMMQTGNLDFAIHLEGTQASKFRMLAIEWLDGPWILSDLESS